MLRCIETLGVSEVEGGAVDGSATCSIKLDDGGGRVLSEHVSTEHMEHVAEEQPPRAAWEARELAARRLVRIICQFQGNFLTSSAIETDPRVHRDRRRAFNLVADPQRERVRFPWSAELTREHRAVGGDGAMLLPPFDDDGATPYLRSIASRCFRALLSRYARIFSDATSDLAPLILPWIFAFSASDSPCGASPALLLLLPEA